MLTRTPGLRHASLPAGVDAVKGDLLEPGNLTQALAGVDTVIHLAAALTGERIASVNVDGSRALAAAALAAGVKFFIHCSSAGVYGDGEDVTLHREQDTPRPGSPYERSKLDGELAIAETLGPDVPWIVLRPAGVYGPGRPATLTFYREVRRRRLWLHGPATVIVHPTFVDDVVLAVVSVVGRRDLSGERFNVAGARALSYMELIAMTASLLGTSVHQFQLPEMVRRAADIAHRRGLLPGRFERIARPLVNRGLDTTKAARAFGFHPLALEEGIRLTVASFRDRGLL